MIHIDGSMGEGGGQILRTSLALSMCTGKPFQISNIRGNRRKPGLLRQHLTAVKAASTICSAEVTGAEIGARALTFVPGKVASGSYRFAVGTAGSATLVLQTILPPLLSVEGTTTIHLEGGTHNQWAPPFHFIQEAFLPMLQRMGAVCKAELKQWGFYPAGGGKFSVSVVPAPGGLQKLDLNDRGKLITCEVLAGVSDVPFEVADDECKLISRSARFAITRCRAEQVQSVGPGNVAMIGMEFEHSRAFFTGFGELGVSRKQVAHRVCTSANQFYSSGATVDEHLADQLLVPMALAGGGSFTTLEPTLHTTTNIEVIRLFLDVGITCKKTSSGVWKLTMTGRLTQLSW